MATATQTAANINKPSKRKAKKDESSKLEAPQTVVLPDRTNSLDTSSNVNGSETGAAFENPHVKELQKAVRNINKKLSSMQKVDSIIAENPQLSLDDLVQTRKINADQKAQALKKPALQNQLVQIEEQIAVHKKLEEDFQERLRVERERLTAVHEKELSDLRDSSKTEAATTSGKDLRQKLLVLSCFLRAAAARRQEGEDTSDESRAFEGVLTLLYGGDADAVDTAEKLINGTKDAVPSTEGDLLGVTYDRVKELSIEVGSFGEEEQDANGIANADNVPEYGAAAAINATANTTDPTETDPTIANAGLTEVNAPAQPGARTEIEPTINDAPEQGGIADGAANAAATEQWDTKPAGGPDSMGDSWVSVPRDPQETESSAGAVANNATQNWADDTPTAREPVATPQTAAHDGFHEVHHGRGGRGRGGSSEQRGGGRGRGGFRGGDRGRGGFRGGRGQDGSRGRGGRGGRGRET